MIFVACRSSSVSRLLEGEKEKLLRLDQILHQRVIGQDEAVQAVADDVIRPQSGLKEPKRPTGVGKSELVRALAEKTYGVRISKSGAAWAKCEGLRVTMRLAPLRRAKVAWSES